MEAQKRSRHEKPFQNILVDFIKVQRIYMDRESLEVKKLIDQIRCKKISHQELCRVQHHSHFTFHHHENLQLEDN